MVSLNVNALTKDRERVIIVTAGDTFSSISLREFGTSRYGRLIAEYNKSDFGTGLAVGKVIRIPIATAPQNQFAEVLFAKGKPVVFPGGDLDEQRLIGSGTTIYASDIIKTSGIGFVSLRFPSGTLVSVQPNSTIQLVALDCLQKDDLCVVEVDARKGTLSTQVNTRNNQPTSFTVRTPHALAAVRGTVFDIDASSEKLLVGVTEGEVELEAQGRSTDLPQGLGVKTLAGQPSSPPIRLLQEPSFHPAPKRVSTEDTVSWFGLKNAVSYQLTLSEDREGSVINYQLAQNELEHSIPELSKGTYYLGVRGIDADGFKGFAAQLPLVAVDVDSAAVRPNLVQVSHTNGMANGMYVSLAEPADEKLTFEIQLSSSEDFLEASSVDVSGDGGMLYQPAATPAYVRARLVKDEFNVGQFGPVLELPAN